MEVIVRLNLFNEEKWGSQQKRTKTTCRERGQTGVNWNWLG